MTQPRVTLFTLIARYRGPVAVGLLFLIASDGCQLVMPLFVKSAIDGLRSGTETDVALRTALLWMAVLVVGIVLARFAWRRFLFLAARQAETTLRQQLLEKVLSLPTQHFQTVRTGDIMTLATNDIVAVRMALSMGLVAGFDASVFALVAIAAMASLDPVLTAWTILPFPVLGLIMAVALRLIYHRWDAVQTSVENLTEKARESLSGMRVLRAFDQADGDLADFERYAATCYDKQMHFVSIDSLYQPSIVVLAGMSSAILLGVGGTRVVAGSTSLGSFTAFVTYLGMLAWPMIAAGWMLTLFQRGAASLSRISRLLDVDSETESGELPAVGATGALEVRHLTFRYPGQERDALTDISFSIPAGGSVGLVGEVGSGKSTIAVLLSRLHEPPAESIFLDGVALEKRPVSWCRRQISWVPQEAFLFSDTIAENLALGLDSATQETLVAACRMAAVHDEILEFPDGYETLLGERGISLSGGQKQRVCLARALLKSAPILVLDDTLSAVDSETEHAILSSLATATAGRSTLVISHRISSLRRLDRILVLHQGEIVQQGTHDELLAQAGRYRDLYELQELSA